MKEIIVRTQAELDAIPENCDDQIVIDSSDEIVVKKRYVHALILRGDTSAELYDTSSAELHDASSAELLDNSQAIDNSLSHNITINGNAKIINNPDK